MRRISWKPTPLRNKNVAVMCINFIVERVHASAF